LTRLQNSGEVVACDFQVASVTANQLILSITIQLIGFVFSANANFITHRLDCLPSFDCQRGWGIPSKLDESKLVHRAIFQRHKRNWVQREERHPSQKTTNPEGVPSASKATQLFEVRRSQEGTDVLGAARHAAREKHVHKKSPFFLERKNGQFESGRHDSNVRPPAPKAGALARLSYAPIH
jgi:hypothetical protein